MTNQYTSVPQASDTLAADQPKMLANFTYLTNTLGKDHQIAVGDLDTASFEGRHIQVSLNSRSGNNIAMPGDGTDSLLWSYQGNLYFKNTTVASGIQMTNSSVGSPSAIANKGYSFLPGGIMICWGTQLATATNPIVFPNSGFGTIFSATGCTSANDRAFGITGLSTTQLTYSVLNPTGVTIYWWAIGAK
jgi:hypothetical protein